MTRPQNSILEAHKLHIRSHDAVLVNDVSFELAEGSSLGIVGESGSGKSLILRAIMGITPANLSVSGEIHLPAPAQTGSGMAMIFQEPAIALNPTLRVGDLVSLTWAKHHPGCTRKEATDMAVSMFDQVGIPNSRARLKAWPHELSGGLRQRVMIAAALATEPRVLLCDEPTTALDVVVQNQILALLRALVAERSMAMLFVSHDLAVVSSVCEQIMVMRLGEVIETGSTDSVLTHPSAEYTRALLDANLARRLRIRSEVDEAARR